MITDHDDEQWATRFNGLSLDERIALQREEMDAEDEDELDEAAERVYARFKSE